MNMMKLCIETPETYFFVFVFEMSSPFFLIFAAEILLYTWFEIYFYIIASLVREVREGLPCNHKHLQNFPFKEKVLKI